MMRPETRFDEDFSYQQLVFLNKVSCWRYNLVFTSEFLLSIHFSKRRKSSQQAQVKRSGLKAVISYTWSFSDTVK